MLFPWEKRHSLLGGLKSSFSCEETSLGVLTWSLDKVSVHSWGKTQFCNSRAINITKWPTPAVKSHTQKDPCRNPVRISWLAFPGKNYLNYFLSQLWLLSLWPTGFLRKQRRAQGAAGSFSEDAVPGSCGCWRWDRVQRRTGPHSTRGPGRVTDSHSGSWGNGALPVGFVPKFTSRWEEGASAACPELSSSGPSSFSIPFCPRPPSSLPRGACELLEHLLNVTFTQGQKSTTCS